jgi:LysR family hydrogen peroxide-inducible transcriptional activator
MNIKDLKYLVAIEDYRNFRKAAGICFVSQPTLSMQLKKLEDFLQIKLIERNNRNIILTQAGKEIATKAREILSLEKDIKKISENYKNPLAGQIKLGAFPTLAPYFFPRIMPLILKKFPYLNIFLIEEKTEKLIDLLNSGELDAAYLALPIKSNNLDNKKVLKEDFFLAQPKSLFDANIKSKKNKISIKDLKDQKILLLEEGHCLREQAMEVCKISNSQQDKTFRATSLETLRNMVASGLGLTLMPELAIKDNDGIKYLPFENSENAYREIALFWRKDHSRQKLFSEVADINF